MTKDLIITCLISFITTAGFIFLSLLERKSIRKFEALRFILTLDPKDFKPWMNSKSGTKIMVEVFEEIQKNREAQ